MSEDDYWEVSDRETKNRILEAARAILYETDSRRLVMRDLVTRAHTSNAVVYRLFGSKDMVLSAILHREAQRLNVLAGDRSSKDALDNLFAMVELTGKTFFEGSSFIRHASSCLLSGSGELIRAHDKEAIGFWAEMLEPLVDEGFIDKRTNIGVLALHVLSSQIEVVRLQLLADIDEANFAAQFGYSVAAACGMRATPAAGDRFKKRLEAYEAILSAGLTDRFSVQA